MNAGSGPRAARKGIGVTSAALLMLVLVFALAKKFMPGLTSGQSLLILAVIAFIAFIAFVFAGHAISQFNWPASPGKVKRK